MASVLDGVLAKQKYLVGDRLTIADLTFYTLNHRMLNSPDFLSGSSLKDQLGELTNFKSWYDEMARFRVFRRDIRIKMPPRLTRRSLNRRFTDKHGYKAVLD
jgi:glutathione S-transferase